MEVEHDVPQMWGRHERRYRVRYASSDIKGFFNKDCPQGGHVREIANLKEVQRKNAEPVYADERLIIDCIHCEPLLNAKDSWTGDPTEIPLTKMEKFEADKLEKQGMKDMAVMGQAMAEMVRERVAANSGS